METLSAITKRCSLKQQVSSREIEPAIINKCLEAACVAGSARNMQPWRFIVVQGKKNIENLVNGAFTETNAMVKGAPVMIVACAKPADDIIRDGKEYYLFDVGLAMENLVLAATDMGLVTHLMSGGSEADIKRILNIPEEVRFVIATPLAYPAGGSYDEASKGRLSQRIRKSLQEVVYTNTWGETA